MNLSFLAQQLASLFSAFRNLGPKVLLYLKQLQSQVVNILLIQVLQKDLISVNSLCQKVPLGCILRHLSLPEDLLLATLGSSGLCRIMPFVFLGVLCSVGKNG